MRRPQFAPAYTVAICMGLSGLMFACNGKDAPAPDPVVVAPPPAALVVEVLSSKPEHVTGGNALLRTTLANASRPILACSSFKSTAGAVAVSAPKTPAARVISWFFQSTIWWACTSCSLASSASVRSPLMASSATLASMRG